MVVKIVKLFFCMMVVVGIKIAPAQTCGELAQNFSFKVVIAPAEGDWFRLLVIGPSGEIKSQKIYNLNPSNVSNLSFATVNGRKLEMALNTGDIKYSDVNEELLSHLMLRDDDEDLLMSSIAPLMKIVHKQKPQNISVFIAPSVGNWFKFVVTGPNNYVRMVSVANFNFANAAVNALKLQSAFDRNLLTMSDLSDDLLNYLVRSDSGKIADKMRTLDKSFAMLVKEIEVVQFQKYFVLVGPHDAQGFKLVVIGPHGFIETAIVKNSTSEKIEAAVLGAKKLQKALNLKAIQEEEISTQLLIALTQKINLKANDNISQVIYQRLKRINSVQ